MRRRDFAIIVMTFMLVSCINIVPASAQSKNQNPDLDEKVRKFLDEHSRRWYDMNVPASDGKLLYDIIIEIDEGRHREALENYETTVNNEGGGVSISYKRAAK